MQLGIWAFIFCTLRTKIEENLPRVNFSARFRRGFGEVSARFSRTRFSRPRMAEPEERPNLRNNRTKKGLKQFFEPEAPNFFFSRTWGTTEPDEQHTMTNDEPWTANDETWTMNDVYCDKYSNSVSRVSIFKIIFFEPVRPRKRFEI